MTILPMPLWAAFLFAAVVVISGCASTEEKKYTTRNCVVTIAQQVAQNAFAAVLFCDQEEPHKEEK